MDKAIYESLQGNNKNYILPFLWMKGEEEPVLRREMQKISECGIGAVCLESRPHPDFMGPGWWRDFDIVLDEAKKRGMRIWILDDAHFPTGLANGLLPKKYPERAKQYLSVKSFDVTGPVSHACLDIESAMKKSFSWMDIGKPVETPLVDERRLVSVVAMRMEDDDTVSTDEIAKDRDAIAAAEAQDRAENLDGGFSHRRPNRMILTEAVKDGSLTCDFPEGVWRVFVVHTTYDEGTRNDYINIIDRASVQVLLEAVYEPHYEHYRDEFGKTIAGFFSDEPGFGNTAGFAMDESIGRKMMPLPWNGEVPALLAERLGESWREQLPLLWYPITDEAQAAEVRYAYMDVVSRLYQRNFSEQLGAWCRERGVEYIGHVIEDGNVHSRLGCGAGHYFRAMSGQAMAGIDNIGNQVMVGNPNTFRHGFSTADGQFYHYMETKLGASAALMQEEKQGRLMCETFGAYGWSFGVRDMKWVADWLIARGVNHLVPHAFSMDTYPDADCPPHFYAGGHNPEFRYFGDLMRYCNRLCHVFSGGRWIPEVGLLYHGEMEWMDDCMMDQVPARELAGGHIDYAIVPSDALADAAGEGDGRYPACVRDGKLVIKGVPLKLLIVPRGHFADPKLVRFMEAFPEVRVIFVDERPIATGLLDYSGSEEAEASHEAVRRAADAALGSAQVVPLKELVETIRAMGVIGARADVKGEASFFHYEKDSGDLWMVFNESKSRPLSGNLLVKLNDPDKRVWRYDAMKNKVYPVDQLLAEGFDEPRMLCTLELAAYESAVFFTATPGEAADLCEELDPRELREVERTDISKGWTVTVAEASDEPVFRPLPGLPENGGLAPVSDLLPRFSGFMRYSRRIHVEDPSARYVVEAEQLFEVGRILVNGTETDFRLCPPYRFALEGLKAGENEITIEAANTPLRDVLNYDQGMFGHEKGFYEPSGMFGRILLVKLGR